MAANLFLRAKPLSKVTTRSRANSHVLLNCAKHNHREMNLKGHDAATGSIDPRRSHLNTVLVGPPTAKGVADYAADLCVQAGLQITRANATLGYELVISLPNTTTVDYVAVFNDTVAWSIEYFRVPVISAVIHLDQAHPHVHLLLLPLRDGKWLGSRLIGPRAAVSAMQKSFSNVVAGKYGLFAEAQLNSETTAICREAAERVIYQFAKQPRDQRAATAVDAVAALIALNPGPLLKKLALADLTPPPAAEESVTDLRMKEMRLIKAPSSSDTAATPSDPEMRTTGIAAMSYVLLADSADNQPIPLGAVSRTYDGDINQPAPSCGKGLNAELIRIREDELLSSTYNLELGEFQTEPTANRNDQDVSTAPQPATERSTEIAANVVIFKPAKK
ncbi:MAG TPA: plasmid recombination protein [Telluria sp.]